MDIFKMSKMEKGFSNPEKMKKKKIHPKPPIPDFMVSEMRGAPIIL
jgi:hypothetical protein